VIIAILKIVPLKNFHTKKMPAREVMGRTTAAHAQSLICVIVLVLKSILFASI
jgi:hypothetical protein